MLKSPKIGVHCGSCFLRDQLEIPRAGTLAEHDYPGLYQGSLETYEPALSAPGTVRAMYVPESNGGGVDQVLPAVATEKQDRGRFRETVPL